MQENPGLAMLSHLLDTVGFGSVPPVRRLAALGTTDNGRSERCVRPHVTRFRASRTDALNSWCFAYDPASASLAGSFAEQGALLRAHPENGECSPPRLHIALNPPYVVHSFEAALNGAGRGFPAGSPIRSTKQRFPDIQKPERHLLRLRCRAVVPESFHKRLSCEPESFAPEPKDPACRLSPKHQIRQALPGVAADLPAVA